jgi:DNA-binding response OmpR family regulator
VLWLYGADTTAHSGPLGSEVWGEILCGPDRVAGVTAGARILVADDEAALRRVLVLYLTRAGYEVVEASDGVRALATLLGGGIDAALIDVMLPEMDGFEVVRQARPHSSIPMLFLTAKGEEAHRVAGLELGADDYIVKPFFAEEVVSRVRAHLRRAAGFTEPPTSLRRGTVELKVSERRCLVSGQEVLLTRREFDLLALLMGHPGQVFSREQLLENVWGSPFFTIKTVDVHISGLRRKLGGSLTISAMRGVGYRLEPH